MEDVCELAWNEVPVFKTGRRDCNPDPTLERPFFTKNHEIHPNLHGNGPTIVDWYKNHFGLTAREGIALTGMAIWVVEFFKRVVQNYKDFCLRINIPKGNFLVLRIQLMGSISRLQKSELLKLIIFIFIVKKMNN